MEKCHPVKPWFPHCLNFAGRISHTSEVHFTYMSENRGIDILNGLPPDALTFVQFIRPQTDVSSASLPVQTNWEALYQIASEHSLVPVFYQALTKGDSIHAPEKILDRSRVESSRICGRNLALKNELLQVLQLLQSNGFVAIPYKGPVFTERLYGNIGLRYFHDLDLLTDKQNVLKIKKLLLANGFTPKEEFANLTTSQEAALLNFYYSYDFISRTSRHQLEIHWKILPRTFSLKLDYNDLYKRCNPVDYAGLRIPAFSNEDLLFLICLMGTKKGWDRLSRVYDAALALFQYRDLDFNYLMHQSQKAGAERILLTGLNLAHVLFGAPLPDSIVSVLHNDRSIQRLTTTLVHQMFEKEQVNSLIRPDDQFQPFHFRIRERFADRVRYCSRIFLTPSVGEWSTIRLPGFAYFLYYLIRPVRLILKGARRIIWKRSNERYAK